MSETGNIRSELERELGPLPDAVWEFLVEDKLVEMYEKGLLVLDDSDANWAFLKGEAEKWVRRAEKIAAGDSKEKHTGGGARGEDRRGEWRWVPYTTYPDQPEKDEDVFAAFLDFFMPIDSKNEEMLRATSDYFGLLANKHPRVAQFREEVLEGKTLASDSTRGLIGSYAARFLSLDWFREWGIPVSDHTSEIVGEYDWGPHGAGVDHRVTVRVDPPGIIQRIRYAHPETPILDEDEDQIVTRRPMFTNGGAVIPPYGAELPEVFEDDRPASPPPGTPPGAQWVGPAILDDYETPSRPLSVWPGSVVDDLYVLAEELADSFHWPGREASTESGRWWRKDAAAQFVLTGNAPLIRPLEARLHKRGRLPFPPWRIEFSVSPWVSAEEVSLAYRRMQDQVIEGSRNRLPGPKTLKVARFVWEQERLNGYRRPAWRVLCEKWNRDNSKQRFESWRHFRTSFERAHKAVRQLNFGCLGPEDEDLPEE